MSSSLQLPATSSMLSTPALSPGARGRTNPTTAALTMQTAPVVSYVQMSFQDKVVRTAAHAGTAPQWNELLALPFKSPGGDYSPNILEDVADKVVIGVFDEVTVKYVADDRDKHTAFTQSENRLIGTVTIPFNTLYHHGHIEGEFRLQAPMASLAYVSKKDLTHSGTAQPEAGMVVHDVDAPVTLIDLADSTRDPHIFVSMTLQPLLKAPGSDDDDTASGNEPDIRPRAPGIDNAIMDHAHAWEVKYKKKHRQIKVRACVCVDVLVSDGGLAGNRMAMRCTGVCIEFQGTSRVVVSLSHTSGVAT